MHSPLLLRIDLVGVGSLVLDPRVAGYLGPAVEALPSDPPAVQVETHPVDATHASEVPADADGLDALLWLIGWNTSEDRATWLWPNDRYRMTRWPSIARIPVGADEVRIFAALAAAHLSPVELAEAAAVDLATAQRAINALSLMGVLEASSSAPPMPAPPAPERSPARGLFSRLRARLGL